MDTIFEGLEPHRHKITHELRIFIGGELEKNSEAIKVVRPSLISRVRPTRRGG